MPSKFLTGQEDYLQQLALANFDFHVAMAYASLRHNGVTLGKGDFIGVLPFQDV